MVDKEPHELMITSSDREPITNNPKGMEEALIRQGLQRLVVSTLAGVAGQAISHTDVVAGTLFKLGMQNQ